MPSKLFEDFKRLSKMAEIDFIKYGLFSGKDWNYKGLKAPYNRVYIIIEGEGFIITENFTKKLKAGYAYLIPGNMTFDTKTTIGMKKLYVHFNMESYFHINMMSNLEEILETEIDRSLFDYYATCFEEKVIQEYLLINGALTSLIYELRSQLDISGYDDQIKDMPEILHGLHRMLQASLTGKTRIGPLAESLGTSQSMLSKVFKTATGMTLKSYMKEQLMTKAQIQLISTNSSIQEIAYGLEYEDALYFSRLFNQWTGMSPTQYRKANKTLYI